MMKISIPMFILLFLWPCSSQDQGAKNVKGEKIASKEKIESPYPTMDVGKGPDALFLTPDHSILYVANVADTIISVVDTKGMK